ncbi:MAG TPA: glutamic-type intramembrane protease PrsW [Bacillus sp. (in: firmicutes)]|uniref:glutamic-type intramembrane protease PrsW n=1 Tax=Bacillus litorisediminis TaxID=2922713 RepID=UPI001FAD2DE9|nr:glutamic-type intramembrane protease PrsW [Bacillus litorisediminis]HWO75842.1 glutamic-type intramembrane protease PrsW [Bacillus sp. (in: firmicutes)]
MLVIMSAGIAPGLALLSYFYLKDEFDSEPLHLVFRSFLFGALLVFPIMFVQYVFMTEEVIVSNLANAFISSALLEEFFKWFMLFQTIYLHSEFDEPYDGIVYGTSISLGFATVENILYLIGNGVEYALGRALLPVSSHALFGVLMGYYFGKGKFSQDNSKKRLFISYALIVPLLLHGFYDYILLTFDKWILWIVPFMTFLWWLGLKKVKRARKMTEVHILQKQISS